MTKRILTMLAAVGGLTVLAAAFVAVYAMRGAVPSALTRAQGEAARSGTAAQEAEAEGEGTAGDTEAVEAPEDVTLRLHHDGPAWIEAMAADVADEPGIVVSALVKDGPAAEAGVKRGDIVLKVGDRKVDRLADLTAALKDREAGDQVKLTIRHGDDERDVTVTLDEQRGHGFLGILPCGPGAMAARAVRIAGGPKLGAGAAVESIVAGGPAAEAGLRAGDVITAVDGQAVDKDHSLADLVAAHTPGDTITLKVDRPRETRHEEVPAVTKDAGGTAEGGEAAEAGVPAIAGDQASPDDSTGGTFEVKIEVEVDPIEVEVVLGEHPDKPGTAYLGLRYRPAGAMFWHMAVPPVPGMPSAPPARFPGDPDAGEPADVMIYRDAVPAVPDAAAPFTFKYHPGAAAVPLPAPVEMPQAQDV